MSTSDYSKTVLLPKTDFPQKANLSQREPAVMERWLAEDIHGQAERRPGRPDFVLHDGPPYANADIHIGHTMNKVLKDIVVRHRTMTGHRVNYVPGWDCHGLPIEQKVIDELIKKKALADKTPLEIRRLCAEYAQHWKDVQMKQFQRLGVTGDWKHPYMTLESEYEADILRAFQALNARGVIYRGLRTVLWDPVFETALAEAEIEYNEQHVSPSIYFRFPLLTKASIPALEGAQIVAWTTTPWTLPANLGITLHPDFDYVAVRHGEHVHVVAKGLLTAFEKAAELPAGEILAEFRAEILHRAECAHPVRDDIRSLVMLGTHVNLEQGTGCVHTAPGHGAEDFEIGRHYGLEPLCPVDGRGCYTDEYPEMKGENVFKANPKIIEKLKERARLVHAGTLTHSYPYSWRSRKPVITRATEQWFMTVDRAGIREAAMKEIDRVQWIPSWGYDRIEGMLRTRPDWCLSRQRSWGVPIPAVFDTKEQKALLDDGVMDKAIALIAKEGADAWFTRPVEDFLPDAMKAEPGRYEKLYDVLDVWFESGCSHLCVLNERYNLRWPADLYLEGADQHRGWFQSSMWVSLGVKGRAPYDAVLTHGFVLDENGRAMSKSLGNVINPLDLIRDYGADILRMWVSSEDYRGDVKVSKNSLDQMAQSYRRFRNTLRFLLGNLDGYSPDAHPASKTPLGEEDRWILHRLELLVERCGKAYHDYEFHLVYHEVTQFCVVDLGSVYLDILKDRLYCDAQDAPRRVASQAAMFEVATTLIRLFAPIVPFTAEEAWGFLPAFEGKVASVHLADFPRPVAGRRDDELEARWNTFLALREEANRQFEALRRDKTIGSNSEGQVTFQTADEKLASAVENDAALLKTLLITSKVSVERTAPAEPSPELQAAGMVVRAVARKATGHKCPRCWQFVEDQGSHPDHPELCTRCTDVVRRLGA